MKAFEKQWKDWNCDIDCQVEKGCGRCEKIAKHWYRVALEWYQDTMDEIEKHDLPIHGQEVIEQELEEK